MSSTSGSGPPFELARVLIEARARAGLTQTQLAERMRTTQSVIARLQSGRGRPSTATLERLARATGSRLKITFEPAPADASAEASSPPAGDRAASAEELCKASLAPPAASPHRSCQSAGLQTLSPSPFLRGSA